MTDIIPGGSPVAGREVSADAVPDPVTETASAAHPTAEESIAPTEEIPSEAPFTTNGDEPTDADNEGVTDDADVIGNAVIDEADVTGEADVTDEAGTLTDPRTVSDAVPQSESEQPTGGSDEEATANGETERPANADNTAIVDYAAMAEADLALIRRLDPAYASLVRLSDLPGASRFAELREMGLTTEEAFFAVCHTPPTVPSVDTRRHLHPSAPRGAAGLSGGMSAADLASARELFSDLSDREIQLLYRRCQS